VKSPYPRHNSEHARRRKESFVRAWTLYGGGCGLIVIGVVWFLMKPSVNYYNLEDFVIGSVFVAIGLAGRRAAQLDLMRLKGLSAEHKLSAYNWVYWLHWYVRLPDNGAAPLEYADVDQSGPKK
jgi:hypothetical protein